MLLHDNAGIRLKAAYRGPMGPRHETGSGLVADSGSRKRRPTTALNQR